MPTLYRSDVLQSVSRADAARPNPRSSFGRTLCAIGVSVAMTACGGGDPDPTPPAITPSFTLTVLPTTASVAAGASATVNLTVVRLGGFTGAVALTTSTPPAGVTPTFSQTQLPPTATSSTLTLAAAATTAPGTYTITVTGTGASVTNQSASVQVTVTAPPASNALFTISASINSYLAPLTAAIPYLPTIDIVRNAGYTGAITFSTTGLPPLLAAIVTPTSVTGSTANIGIVNAGQANGTYTATIRAVGANNGGERTISIPITIASPTVGNITWRICTSAPRYPSLFVAYKDGSGPWTRSVPNDSGTAFGMSITSGSGSVAFVTIDSGVARTTVHNYTQQELTAAAASDCRLYQNATSRTASGQVTPLAASEQALVSMGWWFASAANPFNTTSNYQMLNLPPGPLDLVAVKQVAQGFNIVPTRGVLRRGLNPASGATNALIDINGSESFTLSTATWTVGNNNAEPFGISQYLITAGGTYAQMSSVPGIEAAATTRTVYGVPAATTINGDLQQVVLTIGTLAAKRATRQVVTYQRNIADRTINFGPAMPAPTMTGVSANGAGMIRAQGTLPTEYASGVGLDVKSTGTRPRYATVYASRGALGAGAAYDVRMPDLTAVLGWDRGWNIRIGDVTEWWVSGGGPILDYFDPRFIFGSTRGEWAGIQTGITRPADGQTFLIGRAFGTITP